MKLSIIIPCYNEESTIHRIVARVLSAPVPLCEIIIVDDFSKDRSREILKDLAAQNPKIQIAMHDKNQGKGGALRTGFAKATGDVVVVQDADMEYDPHELPRLMAPIIDGRADAVFGSRFMGGDAHRVVYYWHMMGNMLLTQVSNMFTNINLTDMETCYKMFKRELLEKIDIQENRFGIEPEITAKLAKMGCRIYEVGISYSGRTYEEGKKIGWKDGVRAFYAIVKYNLFG